MPIFFWLQRTANSNTFISNIQHIRQNRIDYSRLLAAFGRKRTFLQNHQGQQKKAPKLPFSGPIICTTCILLQSKLSAFAADRGDKPEPVRAAYILFRILRQSIFIRGIWTSFQNKGGKCVIHIAELLKQPLENIFPFWISQLNNLIWIYSFCMKKVFILKEAFLWKKKVFLIVASGKIHHHKNNNQ